MAKRKLNKQQQHRVKAKQRSHLKQAGQSHRVDQDLKKGQIIEHFGRNALVEEAKTLTQYRCHLRANLGSIVTGDQVAFWLNEQSQGVIEAVETRHSVLMRPNMQQTLKPIAANIDLVFIVIAPKPEPHAELIDRYLVAVERAKLTPIILLNKLDLLDEHSQILPMLESFSELGYQCLKISTNTQFGFDELKAKLNEKVSVFVGQSGVGKSSIINQLLPNEELKIGALSDGVDKGKHTTTSARLYHFESGGDLIDSPGIREFGLWHLKPEEVIEGFIELKALSHQCQFRDCKHQKEPNCALKDGVKTGKIQARRFASYQQIIQSLENG